MTPRRRPPRCSTERCLGSRASILLFSRGRVVLADGAWLSSWSNLLKHMMCGHRAIRCLEYCVQPGSLISDSALASDLAPEDSSLDMENIRLSSIARVGLLHAVFLIWGHIRECYMPTCITPFIHICIYVQMALHSSKYKWRSRGCQMSPRCFQMCPRFLAGVVKDTFRYFCFRIGFFWVLLRIPWTFLCLHRFPWGFVKDPLGFFVFV